MGGIPVIGCNTGGTPELIQDGVNGFLYERGNIQQLADKIRYLIDNPFSRREMGKNAKEYATQHFGIVQSVNKIESVYREVLEHTEMTNRD